MLHNGNVKPLLPVAHSVAKKESYEGMSLTECSHLQEALLADMWGS
jgi:hypothetical protein